MQFVAAGLFCFILAFVLTTICNHVCDCETHEFFERENSEDFKCEPCKTERVYTLKHTKVHEISRFCEERFVTDCLKKNLMNFQEVQFAVEKVSSANIEPAKQSLPPSLFVKKDSL